MRTSIILNDQLGEQLKQHARKRGLSLSAYLAEAGRAALRSESQTNQLPFELITFGGGGLQESIQLDSTNELLAAEDEAKYGQ